jgi:hypothetical protein
MPSPFVQARVDPDTIAAVDARLQPGQTRSDAVRAALFSWTRLPAPDAEALLTLSRQKDPA